MSTSVDKPMISRRRLGPPPPAGMAAGREADPARIAPPGAPDLVGPARGVLLAVALSAALWAALAGLIWL